MVRLIHDDVGLPASRQQILLFGPHPPPPAGVALPSGHTFATAFFVQLNPNGEVDEGPTRGARRPASCENENVNGPRRRNANLLRPRAAVPIPHARRRAPSGPDGLENLGGDGLDAVDQAVPAADERLDFDRGDGNALLAELLL